MTVDELNTLPEPRATDAFTACCAAPRWVSRMVCERPFAGRAALLDTADAAWHELSRDDWMPAIAHHPRIGGSELAGAASARARDWSAGEQASARAPDDSTRAALAQANTDYERRFGHPFIICATGKSASDVLVALRDRFVHEPSAELAVTADELRKITMLRLDKLLAGP